MAGRDIGTVVLPDAELKNVALNRMLEADPNDLAVRAALGLILLSEGREAEAAKSHGELLSVLERLGMLRRPESLR